MGYVLTQHAQDAMQKRRIPSAWLERALATPLRREPDNTDPFSEHRLAVIEEHGGRVLRVIVNPSKNPEQVITLFFDRKMRGKL